VRIVLNGEERDTAAGTVAELVAELGIDPEARGTAVAVDESVVRKARWAEAELNEGARVEVIRAVQGG
jgi:sulfur carrier protein